MTYDIVIFNDHANALGYAKSIGPARLASELRSQGYTCKVIDFVGRIMLDVKLFKAVCESVIGANTLWVGWSSNGFGDWQMQLDNPDTWYHMRKHLFCQYPVPESKFKLFIMWMKKRWPHVKQVYGGSKALPDMDLLDQFDYLLTGLCDAMITELSNHLRNNSALRYRPSFTNKWRIMDHDKLGQSYDFVNSSTKYQECDHVLPGDMLKLETSRGCRFKCKFCSYPLTGRKVTDPGYHRSEQCLADELRDNWQRWGSNRYMIVDDTFNETTEKIESILRARDKAGVDTQFACFARIELIDKQPKQLALLKELGVSSYFFGIETFNPKSGDCIGKGMDPAKVKDILHKVKEFYNQKVSIASGFIVGLPYETPDSLANTMEYLMQDHCPIDAPQLTVLDLNNRSEYKSEFEINYAKYSYKKIGDNWVNDIWSSEQCHQQADYWRRQYHAKTGGPALGFFNLFQVMGLGYSFDDIAFVRWDNLPWTELQTKQTDYYHRYLATLLQYEGIKIS